MSMFEWMRRLEYLMTRHRREEELRQEMDAHREMLGDPRRFGNAVRLRRDAEDVWGWLWLDDVLQDVRFGWRTLRGSPAFALAGIVTLGLATGATTALFSVVNSVLLKPLPFVQPGTLIGIHARTWALDRPGEATAIGGPVGTAQLLAFIEESTRVGSFAGYASTTRHLGQADGPVRLNAVMSDANLFEVLGSAPLIGRTFARTDDPDVAVISEDLWRRQFDSAPQLPGTRATIDGRSVVILGVMPAAFQFPYGATATMPGALPETRTDIWTLLPPMRNAASPTGLRQGRVNVVARMNDGVTPAQAEAELRAISTAFERRQAGSQRLRYDARVVTLDEQALGTMRRPLWLLFAAVGLVLVAACANVANLLLSRMTVRVGEVATRAALGATSSRLVRLFLVESVLLSALGALVGAAIAVWGTRLFAMLGAAKIPRAHEIALDWRAFAFLLAACLVTALLFGIGPALAAGRVDPQSAARDGGRTMTAGRGFRRIRHGLVIAEVALAFVLAVGASWVIQEVLRLRRTDPGMTTDNVVTLHLTPRAPAQEYYAIEERVSALPSVEAAGFTQLLPLQNWGWDAEFSIRDRAAARERQTAGLRYVTPGYFRALQIPLLRGRFFTTDDVADPPVLIVNDAFRRRFFGDDDPVGRALDRGVIVGVVGDVRQTSLGQPAEPELYYVAAQNVTMASDLGMSLVVRTTVPPSTLVPAIRAVVSDVNPNFAIFQVKTMARVVDDSLWELNLYTWLIGAFAALALTLATVGLYGVLTYAATVRSREFAIRIALGSDRASLVRLVLGFGLRLTVAGLIAGAALSAAAAALAPALGIAVRLDPAAIFMGTGVLLTLSLIACAVPAVRAGAATPIAALRQD